MIFKHKEKPKRKKKKKKIFSPKIVLNKTWLDYITNPKTPNKYETIKIVIKSYKLMNKSPPNLQ